MCTCYVEEKYYFRIIPAIVAEKVVLYKTGIDIEILTNKDKSGIKKDVAAVGLKSRSEVGLRKEIINIKKINNKTKGSCLLLNNRAFK